MDRLRHDPVTPGARWTVRCGVCPFARDVAAVDRQTALDTARADHDSRHHSYTVDAVNEDHPLHAQGRR